VVAAMSDYKELARQAAARMDRDPLPARKPLSEEYKAQLRERAAKAREAKKAQGK
jgi:hypothetical protein